jgi:hypothetical protein
LFLARRIGDQDDLKGADIGGYSTRTSARVIASAHFKNAIDIFFPQRSGLFRFVVVE